MQHSFCHIVSSLFYRQHIHLDAGIAWPFYLSYDGWANGTSELCFVGRVQMLDNNFGPSCHCLANRRAIWLTVKCKQPTSSLPSPCIPQGRCTRRILTLYLLTTSHGPTLPKFCFQIKKGSWKIFPNQW